MRSGEDRASPAVIRDEALRLFADRGADAVTVRDVAAAAGVSPALVMHHFGSKSGLRRAVDDEVIALLEEILDRVPDPAGVPSLAEAVVERLPPGSPVPGYLRRLLMSGDPSGMRVFAQWFEIGRAAVGGSGDARSALVVLGVLGRLLLRDQLAAVLGMDPLGRAASRRWADGTSAALAGNTSAPTPRDHATSP